MKLVQMILLQGIWICSTVVLDVQAKLLEGLVFLNAKRVGWWLFLWYFASISINIVRIGDAWSMPITIIWITGQGIFIWLLICCFIIDFPEIGIGISIFVGNVLLLYIVVVRILLLLPTTTSISGSVIINVYIVHSFLNLGAWPLFSSDIPGEVFEKLFIIFLLICILFLALIFLIIIVRWRWCPWVAFQLFL